MNGGKKYATNKIKIREKKRKLKQKNTRFTFSMAFVNNFKIHTHLQYETNDCGIAFARVNAHSEHSFVCNYEG